MLSRRAQTPTRIAGILGAGLLFSLFSMPAAAQVSLFAFMLIPPIAIAFSDKFLGMLALVFSLDIAFLILVLGVKSAGRSYEALDLTA